MPLRAYRRGVQKSIHSPEYGAVLRVLVALRHKAGMTQRDLAQALGREHSFVWRIETGERRLDVVEFFWVCQALGQDARKVYNGLVAAYGRATNSCPGRNLSAKKSPEPPLLYAVPSRAARRRP